MNRCNMRRSPIFLSALLLLTIAGCEQEKSETASQPEAQQEQTQSSEQAPAQNETTASEPAQQSTAQDTETVTNDACLAAARQETGESDITVTNNEFSEANTLVMLGVGAQRAPWKCLVSNDGDVAELSFEGDDSAGVQNSETATSGQDTEGITNEACMAAVRQETNESDITVTSNEFSEANTLVMLGVGAQRAPWRCLVANDGTVQEVSFTGDEGKL